MMADALDIQSRALHSASRSQFRANAGENENSFIHSEQFIVNSTKQRDKIIINKWIGAKA